MKRWWSATILAAGLAAIPGCATFSFKPGASPDTMTADERSCRASAGDAGFVECMRARGWYVSGAAVEEASPLASATPATELRAAEAVPAAPPTVAAVPKAVAAAPVAAVAPSPSPVPTGTVAADATPTATPATASSEPVHAPVASGALPRVRVGSWWKLGGTAAGLDSAIAACVEKLGAPHQPDANARLVTVGLRDCLRSAGWYSYDESAVP